MKVAVVVFPGSNCDRDAADAVENVLGAPARLVWHAEKSLGKPDLVILPGGFSYGDYLRCGAMARFSPVMAAVLEHAEKGGAVLGICNGFQVLCEARLLPGSLLMNSGLRFVCRDVNLRVESTSNVFTSRLLRGECLRMPVAHGDGNWTAPPGVLTRLEEMGQVVFRYADENGEVTPGANPNGSLGNVAGVANERGNVLGLMPHPERAVEGLLGSSDGARLFRSFSQRCLEAA